MATEEKLTGKAREIKGKLREMVGRITGDRKSQAEGTADRIAGDIKQAAAKVKDARER